MPEIKARGTNPAPAGGPVFALPLGGLWSTLRGLVVSFKVQSVKASQSQSQSVKVSRSQSQPVTASQSQSKPVTARHSPPQPVTVSHSQPQPATASQSQPQPATASQSQSQAVKASQSTAPHPDENFAGPTSRWNFFMVRVARGFQNFHRGAGSGPRGISRRARRPSGHCIPRWQFFPEIVCLGRQLVDVTISGNELPPNFFPRVKNAPPVRDLLSAKNMPGEMCP